MPAATVGINDVQDVAFNAGTQRATWYVGLINNASFTSIDAADTMASHANWVETHTVYSEATRPEWTEGAASGGATTNSAAVTFTFTASIPVKGVFLTSVNTKGGTTGILITSPSLLFSTARSYVSGQTLKVTITFQGSM
mgnify:CR=1 FL=1